jgi:hypothetical protein
MQVMARGALRAPASARHQSTAATVAAQQQLQAQPLAQATRWDIYLFEPFSSSDSQSAHTPKYKYNKQHLAQAGQLAGRLLLALFCNMLCNTSLLLCSV